MAGDPELRSRLAERDRGLRRQRTLTVSLVLGTTALAGAFAGLAQHAFSGHRAARSALRPKAVLTSARRRTTVPPPPPLPALGSDYTPAPAAPAQAPAVAASAPVVVSGGS
jgi:hypothetical protein